jgi:eukaryotic-like serine/threonine-protein kinase
VSETESNVSTDQWREAFAQFNALSELDVPSRSARLAELARSNPALAQRVGVLFAPETKAFTQVFSEKSSSATPPALKAGDAIGAYTLEREIGKGGMADVWLGRRTDGTLNRPVAIKLPMAVLPSNVLAERFHRERNILAQLDHPHIARIYDAGTTAQGQPFLALEYIDGVALHDYCTQRRIDLRGRVKLAIEAAHALHHAHSRLILHRDIKPSNILVTGEGALKLLDFGIAKLLDDDRTAEETQFTRLTGAALTPKYAAPEQLTNETVTTSTDVYGLAVVLFELLTNTLPFGDNARDLAGRLKGLNTPALRLTEAPIEEAWAQRFGVRSLARYRRALAGDLEAIVSKALRASASERYDSALAFADDLQRTLDSRPVLARQGLLWYRANKFIARQRLPLAIAAAGALASAGLGLQAVQQQQRATESSARATSINGLMKGLLTGMSPDVAKTRLFSAKELLDRANAYIETSKNNDPEVVSRMGELYRDIGAYDEARRLFASQRDVAVARNDIRAQISASLQLADAATRAFDLAAAQKELDSIQIPLEKNVKGPDALIGQFHNLLGQLAFYGNDATTAKDRYARAEAQWRELNPIDVEKLVWSLEGQANAARMGADTKLARTKMEEVIALDEKFSVRTGLDRARSQAILGSIHIMDGRYREARSVLEPSCVEHAARLGVAHAESRVICGNSVVSMIRTGRLQQAEQQIAAMRVGNATADGNTRASLDFQAALIKMYQGDAAAAEIFLHRYAQLLAPNGSDRASDAALRVQRYVGEAMLRQGKKTEASVLLEKILSEQIALRTASHPDVAVTQVLLTLARLDETSKSTAQNTLKKCVETLRSTRGDHHHFTLAARAYLELLSPSAEGKSLAERLRDELGWQSGAEALAAQIEKSQRTPDFARVPIVL